MGQAPINIITPLSSGLYVVATPIGNLRDITLRALDVLASAAYVLAEDTRHTARLLDAHGIKAKLVSYNDHNGGGRRPRILEDLQNGDAIALVSDAGTPLISDPGWKLVQEALQIPVGVFPLPGASAVLAGLVKSGMPSDKFYFGGFLPPKDAARAAQLSALVGLNATLIFFESPRRVRDTIKTIAEVFGPDCDVAITRELTKRFEETISGSAGDLSQTCPETLKGEIVLCVNANPDDGQMARLEEAMTVLTAELSVKTAADIAQTLGLASRSVAYKMGLKVKNK